MTYKHFKIIENGKEYVFDEGYTHRVYATSSDEAVDQHCKINWISDKKTVKAIEVGDND